MSTERGDATDPRSLVIGASEGDPEAIEDLLDRYLPTIQAIVRRRMGKVLRAREESLDVIQSVCREVIEDWDAIDSSDPKRFRRWLLEAVESKIIDHYRYHTRQKRAPDREVPVAASTNSPGVAHDLRANSPGPSSVAAQAEEEEALRAGLNGLNPELREALELNQFEGLSYEAMAKKLRITPKQARLRVYKAKYQLTQHLRPFES